MLTMLITVYGKLISGEKGGGDVSPNDYSITRRGDPANGYGIP